MTDNTIVELTPFRADLIRSLSRRGERILAAADLADEVAALEPLEAYYIVREIGLDQAVPILLELNQQQLEACIDLDCWNRYDFAVDNLDEWLTAFALAGPEALARAFFSLDYVVQLLYLAQTVTVYDPDTDQVPEEDTEKDTPRAATPDGFFVLDVKNEVAQKTHPFSLLDALYQYDPAASHQLLSASRVDLPTQIEEEALRFRNGRMEDIGFAPPEEAAVLFSRPATRQPLPRPLKPTDNTISRLPSVYAGPLVATSLLQQALSLITDKERLSGLEQEIVWAINSAIIAYGENARDMQQITDIAERVRDTISLGMESLLVHGGTGLPDGAAAKAADLLEVWSITDLFRHGFGATLGLQQEARQSLDSPRFRAWYDLAETHRSDEPGDRLERAFVTALLGRHPLCSGFNPAHAEAVKAFACLADIAAAHVRLQNLVARICR
ncbi:hypothetical protein JWG42_12570 [Desulfoprunum benzoelyticum]|uniref:Uncharacterized protein n=1 Tax=Desulfoprunum benzoelyticum TaxID=1506996 RepID=A0A840UU99_9BACT|nr:DUF6178 family protein [Desulfoprunum benzoelyticum]MBB5349265.1 hypothetical protein [Desulfoprunum benzoelyticum]MBM9530986.1 hypothetical protein [Desulfoprunum benzoelyticum]